MLRVQEKTDVAQMWRAVRKLCELSHRQAMIPGHCFVNETRPEDSYNLPFVLAYAVLDEVLSMLRDGGVFSCKQWELGWKMKASQSYLPWKDYATVDVGREARNDLAHEAVLLKTRDECMKYIDAIEDELKQWKIL